MNESSLVLQIAKTTPTPAVTANATEQTSTPKCDADDDNVTNDEENSSTESVDAAITSETTTLTTSEKTTNSKELTNNDDDEDVNDNDDSSSVEVNLLKKHYGFSLNAKSAAVIYACLRFSLLIEKAKLVNTEATAYLDH